MVPLDSPSRGLWLQELEKNTHLVGPELACQITKHAPTKTVVQRSGRHTCSAGCLWDDIVEYKVLGAWKRSMLHLCIPETIVRITCLAAIHSTRTPENYRSSSREQHDSPQTRGRGYLQEL